MKLHSEELTVLLEVIHNECEGNKNYIPTFGGETSPYVFTKSTKTQMI
jgi:1,4-alpha-glucan branching enzyme